MADLKINNNIPNTTATGTGENGKTGNVTVICYEGFKFNEAPTASYDDYNGDFNNKTLTLSEDGKRATLDFNYCSTYDTIQLYGETYPDTFKPSVSVEIDNNVDNTTIESEATDTGVKLTITGKNKRYRFTQVPTAYYKTTDGQTKSDNFVVSPDGFTASLELQDVDYKETIVVTGKFKPVVLVNADFDNCTVDGFKDFYEQTDVINIYLTANENCLFENDVKRKPTLSGENNNGDFFQIPFTIADNGKTASLTTLVSLLEVRDGSTLNITAKAYSQVADYTANYGTINVYSLTLADLENFAQQRFVKENSDGLGGEVIDLGKYVYSIKRVFVDLPDTKEAVFKVADYNLKFTCKTLLTDRVTLDFGTVEIPLLNGDITDYNSVIEAFLPFVGYISIDNAYCGKAVQLVYDVNFVTGGAVAKLYCDGVLISLTDCEPSTSIQYRTTDFNMLGEQSYNNNVMYGFKPFIKIKWFKSENKNVYNSDNDRVVIADVKGFARLTEVSDITDTRLTGEEKKLIYSTLDNGIYVETHKEASDKSGNLLWDDGGKILWDDGTAIKL